MQAAFTGFDSAFSAADTFHSAVAENACNCRADAGQTTGEKQAQLGQTNLRLREMTAARLSALMAQITTQGAEKFATFLARFAQPKGDVQQVVRLMFLYIKLPRTQIVHPHFPRLCQCQLSLFGFCGFLVCCLCHE